MPPVEAERRTTHGQTSGPARNSPSRSTRRRLPMHVAPNARHGRPLTVAVELRMQEMEKRWFQDQRMPKRRFEGQLSELGKQLKEEHEKVLIQNLRSKEEEALSSKVEQQIREMQDKLRREKHEQEIVESRNKAEGQLKDLERRLADERESWMAALKNQLKERELIEQDVEHNLSRKLRGIRTARFQDEKIQWTGLFRQKGRRTRTAAPPAPDGNRPF